MAKISFLSGAGNETTLDGISRAVTHLYKEEGIAAADDLEVTENDTPDNKVKVGMGAALIGFTGTSPEDKYYYLFADAEELVTIPANSSGNNRIDAIVAYVDTANPAADDNDGAGVFAVIEGTPAGSPSAPTDNAIQTELGAGVRWIRLANVAVDNGFTSIVDADITDTRSLAYIEMRLAGNTALTGRNNANTADVEMWKVNTSDEIEAGANVDMAGNTLIDPIIQSSVQHRVKCKKSGSQAVNTGGSADLTWDQEEYDIGGLHSTSSNTDQIVLAASGVYLFNVYISFNDAENNAGAFIYIKKNGSQMAAIEMDGATYPRGTMCFVDAGSASDYYEVGLTNFSGETKTVLNTSFFIAVRLF